MPSQGRDTANGMPLSTVCATAQPADLDWLYVEFDAGRVSGTPRSAHQSARIRVPRAVPRWIGLRRVRDLDRRYYRGVHFTIDLDRSSTAGKQMLNLRLFPDAAVRIWLSIDSISAGNSGTTT